MASGQKIKGLQLGQKMSLSDLVSYGVNRRKLPFTLNVLHLEKGFISIWFEGENGKLETFTINIATGIFERLKNYSGTPDEILSEVEKTGFDEILGLGITLNNDMRIKRLFFEDSDFGAEEMTPREFAQAIINAYDIPGMDGIARYTWRYINLEQSWQITAGKMDHPILDICGVTVEPITTQTSFD